MFLATPFGLRCRTSPRVSTIGRNFADSIAQLDHELQRSSELSVVTGVVDTLPSGQCVSLLLELISTTHQHKNNNM